jgi:hypothetical protein
LSPISWIEFAGYGGGNKRNAVFAQELNRAFGLGYQRVDSGSGAVEMLDYLLGHIFGWTWHLD